MVNLELYKIFFTVARCGSLTKAAEELYISQPAVSQAIKTLEAQLGTPLFTRMHKGMQLTPQGGELIIKDVEKSLKLLSGVETKLAELRESATGTLRIGASESIFQYILSGKIVEYHNIYPQVKIELVSDVSPRIVELLRSGHCDIGFLNLPVVDSEGIQLSEPIMQLNDVFVVGKRFQFLCGRELRVAELGQYPLLLMERNTVARSSFENFCLYNGVNLVPSVEVDSWDFMKRLVTYGMGVGCIPREYALRRLADGELFELNVQPGLPARSVGMALPDNANLPYALRAFTNLFN